MRCLGIVSARIATILVFAAWSACAGPIFVTGPGPARARIEQLTHVMQREPFDTAGPEVIRVVTVTNPTGESVVVDCDDFRAQVPAHREQVFSLYDDEGACDLQPASTYSPNSSTGNVFPGETTGTAGERRSWRPRRHRRSQPW